MEFQPKRIETQTAMIARISPSRIELRFKPDMVLDPEGLGEVIRSKRALCGSDRPDVLAVLPGKPEFTLDAIAVDHHAVNGGCAGSRRLAFVGECALGRRLLEIYFKYHPREHETRIFSSEVEAARWLDSFHSDAILN